MRTVRAGAGCHYRKIFRQINSLVITLLSRNFCWRTMMDLFCCKTLINFRENTFRAIEKQLSKSNDSKERVSAFRKYRKEIASKDLMKYAKCSKFTDSKLVTITCGDCNQNNFFTNEDYSKVPTYVHT